MPPPPSPPGNPSVTVRHRLLLTVGLLILITMIGTLGFAPPEQYWQWFRELNPITVTQFEKELRERDLQPWRVAIRTEDLIEYTPEIEAYPMQDLATAELYVSCINKKPGREAP